jgi:carbamoyl-phosphate synthase small subunit
MMKPAALLLADGTRFDGEGLGFDALALGEAVFYTGMTGYEEALTDPSYAGQLLTFTYPMIGNYGISGTAAQHGRACVSGAIVKRISKHPSHHQMTTDLGSWLVEQRVPTLVGVDTCRTRGRYSGDREDGGGTRSVRARDEHRRARCRRCHA